MPKTDDNFLVFSWNLEKKGVSAFERRADTAELIAGGLARSLVGVGGEPRPFVGFLMEVTGKAKSVDEICRRLKEEFERQRGTEANFEARPTGGSSSTREWMIVVSQGLDVKVSDLNVRDEIKREIDADADRAALKAEEHQSNIRALGLRMDNKKRRIDKQVPRYRVNKRKEDEFRNGVVAEFVHAGRSYRVGSIHAPGPEIMESFPGMLPAIQRAAINADVHIMSADLNKHGEFDDPNYDDLTRKDEGTTFSKKTGGLGTSRRDRVLVKKNHGLSAKMRPPIPIQRAGAPPARLNIKRKRKRKTIHVPSRRKKANANDWARLTDHALMVTEVSPALLPTGPLASGAEVVNLFARVDPEPPPLTTPPPPAVANGATMSEAPQTMGEARLTTPTEPVVSPLSSASLSESTAEMEFA